MNIKTTKTIGLKLLNPNCIPKYTKPQQDAMDCFANISEPITINPRERVMIPLGFCIDLPEDWYIDVRPRSGLAVKNGITILNAPGLVDEDFVDEVKAILINTSNEPFTVNPLDRVCQIQAHHLTRVSWELVNEISEKGYSHEGFGSSGVSGNK